MIMILWFLSKLSYPLSNNHLRFIIWREIYFQSIFSLLWRIYKLNDFLHPNTVAMPNLKMFNIVLLSGDTVKNEDHESKTWKQRNFWRIYRMIWSKPLIFDLQISVHYSTVPDSNYILEATPQITQLLALCSLFSVVWVGGCEVSSDLDNSTVQYSTVQYSTDLDNIKIGFY